MNPTVAPPKDKAASKKAAGLAAPLLSGLCCLGILLLLAASTIILALIPVYLSNRSVPAVRTTRTVISELIFESVSPLTSSTLNNDQVGILERSINSKLASTPSSRGTTATILSTTVVRAITSIRAVVLLTFEGLSILQQDTIAQSIRIFIITDSIADELAAVETPTTTTASATTTIGNSSRLLARRSLTEGGAPTGITYIDTHRIAGVHGKVRSVSFYIDRTCAMASVEFGAFELLNRDTETNTAELVIMRRSGLLHIPNKNSLKSSMSLITINLCSQQYTDNIEADCQGEEIPIMAHQYIGVKSDTCRLGFADPPTNRIFATTWVAENSKVNAFADSSPRIKYVPSDYIVLQSISIQPDDDVESIVDRDSISGSVTGPRALFIGSYPPRRCGLASFLEDLTNSYPYAYGVVAVDEATTTAEKRDYSDKVVFRLPANNRDAYYKLAEFVSNQPYDIVNIQHEYGLFGGMMGEYILAFMSLVRKPVVSTFHTVIPEPDPLIMSMTRAVCSLSKRVIVMTEWGRNTLIELYGISADKIIIVPHGVPDVPFPKSLGPAKEKLGIDSNTPVISTFGLVHRNKNIELALKALKKVTEAVPNVKYLVIGQTHPSILLYEGEAYRNELIDLVNKLGLTKNVQFINRFLNNEELIEMLIASDIYLTPYAREDQYVSGTLSWAVGLGKAVVSTPYIYAKELLNDGRGFIVPFNDAEKMGVVLTSVIQKDQLREEVRERAYEYGRETTWVVISEKLGKLFSELIEKH